MKKPKESKSKTAEVKAKPYGYHSFVSEIRALPEMIAIETQADWERGHEAGDHDAFPPKGTADQWLMWAVGRGYEETLKYGIQGRKLQFEEDGVTPKVSTGKRGRPKGWKKPVEGAAALDEFGMPSDGSPAKTKKKTKVADQPKKKVDNGGNLRIPEMIERGILKVGAVVSIKGHDKSEATIVDGKTVKYGKKELGFNQWGIEVIGHTAVNIYKHAMYEGKLFQELRTL